MNPVDRTLPEVSRMNTETLRIPITDELASALAQLQGEVEDAQGRLNAMMSGAMLSHRVVHGDRFQILNTSPPEIEITGAVVSQAKANAKAD